MTDEVITVAKEVAVATGFDIETEDHGLFRAVMQVLCNDGLRAQIIVRAVARCPRLD